MTPSLHFCFYPLRFEFIAKETLFFPPGKAANTLRGALGAIFRRIACVPRCVDSRACELRGSCTYARIFEPAVSSLNNLQGGGPSGLADWPRPFVFRARHLDGQTVVPYESFYFDLHVFSPDRDALACFMAAFAALAQEGLGPNRGKAELRRVVRLATGVLPEQTLYEPPGQMISAALEPVVLDLSAPASAPARMRVEFLSPTELKHEHKIAERPEFPILFGRIRDRLSMLRKLYGPGALDIDFQGTNARAAAIRMTRCDVRRQELRRRSTRTGQTHSIGGFVGVAEYEGDLAEFIPFLEAARWIGVGRQSVWGKGELSIGEVGSPAYCPMSESSAQ